MEYILPQMEEEINIKLKEIIPKAEGKSFYIYEAIRYSLLAGGKRIRPILTLLTYEAVGGKDDLAYPFACAIEMIHTYSLIHDDLPALDNDHLRRGQATSHVKFNEWTAILAGDALLNLAFETMLKASMKNPDKAHIEAMHILAKSSGVEGMLGGQVIDILSEDSQADIETINFINEKKTAALIIASIEMGAVLGEASFKVRQGLVNYAKNLGIAFQIADDILDLTSTDKALGKPVNSDLKNKKTNYVSIYGLNEAKSKLKSLTANCIKELKQIDINSDKLEKLAVLLEARTY